MEDGKLVLAESSATNISTSELTVISYLQYKPTLLVLEYSFCDRFILQGDVQQYYTNFKIKLFLAKTNDIKTEE